MNKPQTVCDRCIHQVTCLLEFDGKNCQRIRSVRPTNADRIRAMNNEELAEYLNSVQLKGYVFANYQVKESDMLFNPEKWLEWLEEEARK